MAVSSLPSPYGIGTLGKEARTFVDFLAAATQRWRQILPAGPTSYGDHRALHSYPTRRSTDRTGSAPRRPG